MARKGAELVNWYDYGFVWARQDLGLRLVAHLAPSISEVQPSDERAFREYLNQIFSDVQDYDVDTSDLEKRLDLSDELKERSEITLASIASIESVDHADQVERSIDLVSCYRNAVLLEIGADFLVHPDSAEAVDACFEREAADR